MGARVPCTLYTHGAAEGWVGAARRSRGRRSRRPDGGREGRPGWGARPNPGLLLSEPMIHDQT